MQSVPESLYSGTIKSSDRKRHAKDGMCERKKERDNWQSSRKPGRMQGNWRKDERIREIEIWDRELCLQQEMRAR